MDCLFIQQIYGMKMAKRIFCHSVPKIDFFDFKSHFIPISWISMVFSYH